MEGAQGSNKRTTESPTNNLIIKRIKNDNIMLEIEKIRAILPISEETAYDALERYLASPDRFNLALVWCLENTNSVESSQNNNFNANPSSNNNNNNSILNLPLVNDKKVGEDSYLQELDELTNNVVGIFLGIDPLYVQDELIKIWHDPNKAEILCTRLMAPNAKYPLLKDRQEMEELNSNLKDNAEMNVDKFLKRFPNPHEIFIGDKRPQNTYLYTNIAISYLMDEFNILYANYIRKVFAQMKQNYTLTHEELTKLLTEGMDPKFKLKSKRCKRHLPILQNEFFIHELFYVKNRMKIDNYEEDERQNLAIRIAQARRNRTLETCQCCCDDEVLIEEMIECTDGHLFCKQCLKKAVEVGVSEGLFKFNCFTGDCKAQFSYPAIQSVSEPKLFSNLLKLSLEDELRMADIPDLVSCPFCSFCVIMPDINDKLFRCLNPECMKETCRLCKEPNHIPLRCDEVEKSLETKMRTFIENYMAEAMLRTCYKCNKRFYKVEGCNKMTCQCGAHMCYLCRQPIHDYSHFDTVQTGSVTAGKCILYTDIDKLHKTELAKAADEARKKFSTEYPEAATIDLKYDPANLINNKAAGVC